MLFFMYQLILLSFCFYREESSLVEQFVFEVLVIFVESLALAHSDERSMGKYAQSLHCRFCTLHCVDDSRSYVPFIRVLMWLDVFEATLITACEMCRQWGTVLCVFICIFHLPSAGTLQQCGIAIDHLKRIIKQKAPSLNEQSAKRRIPRSVLYRDDLVTISWQ